MTPGSPHDRSPEQAARWLLAQLLDWHRREDKAFWWRFFELAGMTDEELVDQREPLGRVEFVASWRIGSAAPPGSSVPLSAPGPRPEGRAPRDQPRDGSGRWGEAVRDRRRARRDRPHRDAQAHEGAARPGHTRRPSSRSSTVSTDVLRTALARIGCMGPRARARRHAGRNGPRWTCLLRRPPRTRPGPKSRLQRDGETPLQAAVRLGLALDDGTLAIQGPPGSGKTHTAAQDDRGAGRGGQEGRGHREQPQGDRQRAGRDRTTPPSRRGVRVRIGQKAGERRGPDVEPRRSRSQSTADVRTALATGEIDVVGGTAWLWSAPDMEGSVDVLFVDEAGQFSLANAIAVVAGAADRSCCSAIRSSWTSRSRAATRRAPSAARSGTCSADDAVMPRRPRPVPRRHLAAAPGHVPLSRPRSSTRERLGSEPSARAPGARGVAPADGTGMRWLAGRRTPATRPSRSRRPRSSPTLVR